MICFIAVCSQTLFESNECARPNAVYGIGGKVCKNLAPLGDCTIEKVILAVNLNGPDLQDSNGFQYTSADNVRVTDNFEILRKRAVKERIKNTPRADELIYQTMIYLEPSKREPNKCISYRVTICEEGRFELSLKLVETHRKFEGEKTINIKLNGIHAFPEFDILAFTPDRLYPLDLVVNFLIKDSKLVINGHEAVSLKDGLVELSFCYGECIFSEGAPAVSAFSVVKLAERSREQQTEAICNQHHKNRWDCLQAKCRFNEVTGHCSKYYQENTCKPKCSLTNLELVFLVDTSLHVSLNAFPRILDVVDKLKGRFKSAKFGITGFSEWKCLDWHQPTTCDKDNAWVHNDTNGCYKSHQRLTTDTAWIQQNSKLPFLKDGDRHQPVIRAIMMTAADTDLGWTSGKSLFVSKIIMLVTGSLNHFWNTHYGSKVDPKGDGKDTCEKHGQPSKDLVYQVLKREGISLHLMLFNETDIDVYKNDTGFLVGEDEVDIQYGKVNDDIGVLADEIFSLATSKRDAERRKLCECSVDASET